ncbi:MAG: TVP38/TMEM64 family protein [Chloroflexi bacterium]|nr:TVP38/TMEM64 family protein [Chloroflexota bacterium]
MATFGDREQGRSRIVRIALIALALLIVALILREASAIDVLAFQRFLRDLGPIAPVGYVVIYALQVIAAPVPGLPIGAAAGLAFGLVPALALGFLGLAIGIVVATWLGRRYGYRVIERVFGRWLIERWESYRFIDSPSLWLIVFLAPSPDLILFIAGMSRIRLRVLVPVGLIGRAPAMVIATVYGVGLAESGPELLIGATVAGFLFGCLAFLVQRYLPRPERPMPAPENPD